MSELSFLIDLLLNHRLSKEVKILVAERIKEIESMKIAPPTVRTPAHVHMAAGEQAPSTLANLTKEPVMTAAPTHAPIINRIVGGEISTGNGTRGPRKF